MNDEENLSNVDYYRQLLKQSQIFLTEVEENHSSIDLKSSTHFHDKSILSGKDSFNEKFSSRSSSAFSSHLDQQLISTRQRCHQRLLACSRKKLRLLSLQEQNEKRHLGFKRFIDNLDEKRSSNIRRYQMELRDYLLNRLETDRLKEELTLLTEKIDQLKQEKKKYFSIIDIVQKAIPLFPPGTLQGGTDGIKSLILRYQTLTETKNHFQQRDFSNEKQERRRKLQLLILEHHTNIAKLSTRLAQLHDYLNDLQKNESIKEEKLLNQIDLNRLTNTTLTQLLSAINYLYDRYRLVYQIKQSISDPTPILKLRVIQEFIQYRMDLVHRAKPSHPSH